MITSALKREGIHGLYHALGIGVEILLRRLNASMPGDYLDGLEVRPAVQEPRECRVAGSVTSYLFLNQGCLSGAFD